MQDLNDKITGSVLTAAEFVEIPSEIQNVIENLGQTLTSGDLNQLGKAIAGYVANGDFYTDSGIANAYVLTKIGLKQTAPAYTDGFFISFIAGNNSTSASTVNVAGLGVKNIKLPDGTDPIAGDVSGLVSLIFDNSNDRFRLLTPKLSGEFNSIDLINLAVRDEGTDNTSLVQTALAFALGRPVIIPDKAFFDLSALTFPDNIGGNGFYILDYRANDDTSSPTHPTGNNTNERVRFMQNNNPSGYNNEFQFSSGFSTGLILDVRRDVDNQNIGAGQDVEFGRTSFVWAQDGLTRVQAKYTDSAGDTSSPGLDDGFSFTIVEPRVTLTGLDDTDFTGSPALEVNDMIRGLTSGARGWVKSFGAGQIIVTLLSGKFVNERLIRERSIQSTVGSLTSVSGVTNTTRSNKLGFSGKQSGNVFGNLQGDDAAFPFNIGGIIGVQRARQINANFTHAELIAGEDLSDLTTLSLRWRSEAGTGDAVLLVGDTEFMRVTPSGVVTLGNDLFVTGGGITAKSFTNAQLNALANPINTTNKKGGLQVYNLSVDRPVWAFGSAAADVWRFADGTTANTPI